MSTLKQNIDKAFYQAMQNLSSRFNRKLTQSAMYLEFLEKDTKLSFFSKSKKLEPIQFSDVMSNRMIGLGITIEKVYMSLQWLKSICQKDNKGIESLSFFLYSTANTKQAIIGVCINSKHAKSYLFSDVLKQFDSKQEHLN